MLPKRWPAFWLVLALAIYTAVGAASSGIGYLSPVLLVAADKTLFVACATGKGILYLDVAGHKVPSFVALLSPSGLTVSEDGAKLFVTCSGPEGQVCVVRRKWPMANGKWEIEDWILVGHTAMAPVLSVDGRTLYVCNRSDNDVSVIDLGDGSRTRRELEASRHHRPLPFRSAGRRPRLAAHEPNQRSGHGPEWFLDSSAGSHRRQRLHHD